MNKRVAHTSEHPIVKRPGSALHGPEGLAAVVLHTFQTRVLRSGRLLTEPLLEEIRLTHSTTCELVLCISVQRADRSLDSLTEVSRAPQRRGTIPDPRMQR